MTIFKHKKRISFLIAFLLALFIGVNILSFMHAYLFTHFVA